MPHVRVCSQAVRFAKVSLMDKARGLFVVKTGDRAVKAALAAAFTVEEIGDDSLVVNAAGKGGAEAIRKVVGASISVLPVLVDDAGEMLYPTGGLAVRFLKTPSETALRRFAKAKGLKVRQRNTFVPAKVAFEPEHDGDLPAVVETRTADAEVQKAWPETRSRYRKA